MDNETVTAAVSRFMAEFAERTSLSASDRSPVRYLWTDAFGVCNFLELYRRTNDSRFKESALLLVDQVHHVLGRHRPDDPRRGWISGLDERQGEEHPTAGGLRIGKKFRERDPQEPYDQALEWERDGQYYHYLTKWMHALNLVFRFTDEKQYLEWAVELAGAAQAGFVYRPAGGGMRRMFWKMSIDLTRPLVQAMGQHDPLDGLVSCLELRHSSLLSGSEHPAPLQKEIDELADLCQQTHWGTDDPLGLGGLLWDACWLAKVHLLRGPTSDPELLPHILEDCLEGLASLKSSDSLSYPAEHRLAFRELGLAIGLQAAWSFYALLCSNFSSFEHASSLKTTVESILQFVALGEEINGFWMESANQQASTWQQHREINTVMLATSLAPESFLSADFKDMPSSG